MVQQQPEIPPSSTGPAPAGIPQPYPATLSIDYPDRPLNRLTSFFRIFTAIPIYIVMVCLTGFSSPWRENYELGRNLVAQSQFQFISTAGVLFLAVLLMILFRKKYPKWWYDWNLNIVRN